MFGFWEGMIVLVIVLVVFGGSKLPELGNGIGKMIRNIKDGVNDKNILDITPEKPGKKPDIDNPPDEPKS